MLGNAERRRVVLLVEDDPDQAALALRAFARSGFDARMDLAADGEAALRYLQGKDAAAGSALPDLVLLDIQLPRLDGIEVLRRIRAAERTRLLPVIMLSTSTERRDVLMSYALGANAYVKKPVDFDAFVEALTGLVAFWLGLNEPPPND